MTTLGATVDALQLLGEPTRVRLMALLGGSELTVAEIVSVTGLAQSSVSTHLGRLREAGLLRDRKAGASTYYATNESAMPAASRKLWDLVRGEVRDGVLEDDRSRATKVVRARERAAGWPEAAAGEMVRHWSPGRTWESLARAMTGLVSLGDVLDVGSGDGSVAQILVGRARTWTCVDRSERVLAAARVRLGKTRGTTFVEGDAAALPMPDASFDVALVLHVLTQVDSPGRVVAEVVRVLRPGGTVVVTTLDVHDHQDVTAAYGDVYPGFAPAALRRTLSRAGLEVDMCEVTSRDPRSPGFKVVTAFARRPHAPHAEA